MDCRPGYPESFGKTKMITFAILPTPNRNQPFVYAHNFTVCGKECLVFLCIAQKKLRQLDSGYLASNP